jgi:hypothetical protein
MLTETEDDRVYANNDRGAARAETCQQPILFQQHM